MAVSVGWRFSVGRRKAAAPRRRRSEVDKRSIPKNARPQAQVQVVAGASSDEMHVNGTVAFDAGFFCTVAPRAETSLRMVVLAPSILKS